jgi:membrane fusion protein
MTDDLFREDALAYQSASSAQFGETTGLLPPSWGRITLLFAAFISALLLFLFNVSFARKETVRGKLRFDGAEAKVFALEPGIVANVFVSDEQIVAAGDPMFEVRSEHYMTDGQILSDQVLTTLRREKASLKEQISALTHSAHLSRATAQLAREDALRRKGELESQRFILAERLDVAERRRADIANLREKGLVAEPVFNEREEAVVTLKQSLLQIDGQIADTASAARQAATDILQVDAGLIRDRSALDQRIAQIDSQTGQTSAARGHVVRAPQEGRVAALRTRSGEQVEPGVPLAIVLPNDAALIAELYLPSRAAGFVEPGQAVKLMYDAYPYQKFGIARGEVRSVAAVAQRPDEIGIAAESPELLYRVRVAPEDEIVRAFGKAHMLQPGMELSADIVLEDRQLVDWLLEPLKSVR